MRGYTFPYIEVDFVAKNLKEMQQTLANFKTVWKNIIDFEKDTALVKQITKLMQEAIIEKWFWIEKTGFKKRKYKGNLVPVTRDGGMMRTIPGKTPTGVRTGYLKSFIIGEVGGRGLMGMPISTPTTQQFVIYLNDDEFWKQYPLRFNEWLMDMCGFGILELLPDMADKLLNNLVPVIEQAIYNKLEGFIGDTV